MSEVPYGYTKTKRYSWRDAREGDVDAYGNPLRPGLDTVIVKRKDCPTVYVEFDADYGEDGMLERVYANENCIRRTIFDPSLVDEYIPAVSTGSAGGYFCPRKRRAGAMPQQVWVFEKGERRQVWTSDYYTLTSFVVINGQVYLNTGYITAKHAEEVILLKFGKTE